MVEDHLNVKLKTNHRAGRDFRTHQVQSSLFKKGTEAIDNSWMTHKVLNYIGNLLMGC